MARRIADTMGASYRQASTLVRTELCYVNNQAAIASIKDAGAERYRFIATLDNRTSSKCRALDGKTFKVEDAAVGTNMPPMHVRCRSTTAIEYGEQLGKRIARDADGKTIRVPANMKYADWKTVYIDKKQTLEEWEKEKGKQSVAKSDKIKNKEEFTPAKTVKAAEQYAVNSLGFMKASYKDIDIAVANDVNKSLKNIYREYPILKGFVQEVGTSGKIKATAQAQLGFNGKTFYTKMLLSKQQINNSLDIEKMIDQAVKNMWWTPKNGVEGIVKHELGHMLEYAMTLRRYGVNLATTDSSKIKTAYDALKRSEISNEIKEKALAKMRLTDNAENIKNHLSKYGNTNAMEFLAEAVSEVNPRDLAKAVVDLINEELERGI